MQDISLASSAAWRSLRRPHSSRFSLLGLDWCDHLKSMYIINLCKLTAYINNIESLSHMLHEITELSSRNFWILYFSVWNMPGPVGAIISSCLTCRLQGFSLDSCLVMVPTSPGLSNILNINSQQIHVEVHKPCWFLMFVDFFGNIRARFPKKKKQYGATKCWNVESQPAELKYPDLPGLLTSIWQSIRRNLQQ